MDRALIFGTAAAAYERFRLGYPDEVLDRILRYARLPVTTALEVGAGTGKATRLFAKRGISVTATDPDGDMLAELRRQLPGVRTLQAGFEQLTLEGTYDCVYSAAALHWTEPQGRWERVFELLGPGGVFASFGAPVELADPALRAAEQTARWPVVDDNPASPVESASSQVLNWPGTELEATPLFDDVEQHLLPRQLFMSADEYVGQLATLSAYLLLEPAERNRVLGRVHDALPAEVAVDAGIVLHLARRSERSEAAVQDVAGYGDA